MTDGYYTLPVGSINIEDKKRRQYWVRTKKLIVKTRVFIVNWWTDLVKTEEGIFDDYVTKTREEELKEIK